MVTGDYHVYVLSHYYYDFSLFFIFQTSYYHITNSITVAERPSSGRNAGGKYRDNTAGESDNIIKYFHNYYHNKIIVLIQRIKKRTN